MIKKLYFLLFISLFFIQVHGSTITSTVVTGNWATASTWSGGVVPTSTDNVIIANGTTITINTTQLCTDLTIAGGLTFAATATLTASGNLTFQGTGATNNNSNNRSLVILGNMTVAAGATSTLSGINFSVAGTSTVNGQLNLTSNTGTRTLTGDVTINSNGSFNFATAVTMGLSGNLIMAGTATIDGASTGVVNVGNNFSVSSGASATIGNTTIAVTGLSTITGTLQITNTGGNKNFNGNLVVANNGNITFTVAETLTIAGTLTCNGTNSITYSAAGIITLGGAATFNGTTTIDGGSTGNTTFSSTLSVPAAATLNIGNTALTVSNGSTLGGTLAFTNANGTKTFGDIIINLGGAWNAAAVDQTYNIAGNLTNNGTFNAGATTATVYSFTGTSQINGTLSISSITVVSGTTTNNATITVSNQLSGAGTFAQGTTGYLYYSASSGITVTTFIATTSSNTVNYTLGGAQTVKSVTYYNLIISTSGTKTLGGAVIVSNNFSIVGTAQLDVSSSNYALTIGGNWNVTSTISSPFVPQAGTVTFNGASGTQTISNSNSHQQSFYNLTVSNTSAASPGVQLTNDSILVTNSYNHTSGILDLKGYNLAVTTTTATSRWTTSTLSGGNIITSVSGSNLRFTDNNTDTALYVNFIGTKVGNSSFGVPLTISAGKINLQALELYGVGKFTKIFASDDASSTGSNKYHNNVIFTAANSASRWRMSTGTTAVPDTFLAHATFNAFANTGSNNNFILGANSTGNYYADSVYLTSTTNGGLYIGRDNGGGNSSHIFNGPVVVNVTLTGNVSFADGASGNVSHVTFNNTFQLNSSNTSTGDIYIGEGNAYSSITIGNPNGQLVDGNILGSTTIHFYNVTQNGSILLQKTTNSGPTNSNIIIGSASYPCVWNAPVTFTAPDIDVESSTFNGATNIFTMNGTSANQITSGGNTFASGTNTTFINNGTVYWHLANTIADNYYGNVTFQQTNTGVIVPNYQTNCNYAGNITVTSLAGTAITFGNAGVSGKTNMIGTSAQNIILTTGNIPTFRSLLINNTNGGVTINTPVYISDSLALKSGLLNTTATNIVTMLNGSHASALTSASASYVNGPMTFQLQSTATTTLNFPIGLATSTVGLGTGDCRPIALTAKHTTAGALFNYTAQLYSGNAFSVGTYTNYPATVDTLSGVHYWQIVRTDNSPTPQLQPTLDLSGNQQIQLFFDTDDQVYNGSLLTVCKTLYTSATNWYDIGQGSTTIGTTQSSTPLVGSITSSTSGPTAFNSFSYFTLGRLLGVGKNPLPIELLSFSAIPNGQKVDVKWETATETNNAYFTIEKSKDGINFTKLIDVPGADNSSSYKEYAETDYQPYSGTSYYRLKQTDYNGNFKYFNIVPVNFENQKNIVVYPNPISNTNNFTVEVNGYKNQEVLVALRDVQGREFLSKVLLSEENNQLFILNETKSLPAGTYIVTASSNDKIYNYKLIVK